MCLPCIEQLAASTDTDEDIVYDQLVLLQLTLKTFYKAF